MKEFVCVNDEKMNCGTVRLTTSWGFGGPDLWVHTGNPNTKLNGYHWCDQVGVAELGATPSTMEVV